MANLGHEVGRSTIANILREYGIRIPNERLAGGRNLLSAMRHGGATLLKRSTGPNVLFRPDGYIAEFTDKPISDYFGVEVIEIKAAR